MSIQLIREIMETREEIIRKTGKRYLLNTQISLDIGMNPRKLGTAYSSNKIVFNKKAMSGLGIVDIRRVVIHEFFHIIAFHEYKGENIGHGKKYKDLLAQYGFDREIGKSKTKIDSSKIDVSDYKYTVHCECCGKIIGYRNRKVNVDSLRSKCCKANVVFVENK